LGTVTLGSTATGVGTLNIGAQWGYTAASGGTLNAATVTTGAGSGILEFNTTGSPCYFTRSGLSGGAAIAITGSTQVTNTAGYNVLSGADTYSGLTSILGGTLADGAANAFSPNSSVSFYSGSNLNVNFNETVAGLNSSTTGSGTASIASGATLTINGAYNYTFSGVISGVGALAKTGAGTETLSGANIYTGGTVVDNGTLSITNGGSISNPSAGMTVGNIGGDNGALSITNGGSVTAAGLLTIGNSSGSTGNVTVNGSGSSLNEAAARGRG
jgi:autotransporter-associated beta strand protein